MTARAVAIGLVYTVILCLVMNYNDFYLKNTLLIGNHFPTAGMAILLVLVLGGNAVARRWFRARGLSAAELLLIWSMTGVAGGVCATGFMRYIPGWSAGPAYYATASNEYAEYLLRHLPSWMLVSKDGTAPAVRWFFEGLPRGARIPWGPWLVPLAAWSALGACLAAVMFALTAMFYRQWADRERLVFPVTYLPLEVAREAPAGRALNGFLRNPLVWTGAAVPILVYGFNGMRTYVPGLPAIPLTWSGSGWFADRPWSELDLDTARVYFSIIGLTFLLTTEISFSLWAFYLLYRLSFVYIAWLGSGATGYWGKWWLFIPALQAAGAILVVAWYLSWTARGALRAWGARALAGEDELATDVLNPRLTLLLLAGGFGGAVAWLILAGASWWAALAGITLFVCTLLVLTRLVAEAGILFVATNAVPFDVLTNVLPPSWLSGDTLATFMMQKGALNHDVREFLMPYLMNAVRACSLAGLNARRVLGVLAVTAAVALGVSAVGKIATCYKYGGVNGDDWAHIESERYFIEDLVNFEKSPPPYDRVAGLVPVGAAHVATGAALAGGLLFLRARFVWWPLNPFGFILCGTWAMVMIWFSVMMGWAAKACVMRFGGATAYRRVLPVFLGLVLGEALIATVWVVTSLITGAPGMYILPD